MKNEDLEMDNILKKDKIFEKIINKYKEEMKCNPYILKDSLQEFLLNPETPAISTEQIEEGAFFVIRRPFCHLELINNKNENKNYENDRNKINDENYITNRNNENNNKNDKINKENKINIGNNLNNGDRPGVLINEINNGNKINDGNKNEENNNNRNNINTNDDKILIDIEFLVKAKFINDDKKEFSFWVCSLEYLKEQLMHLGYKEAKIIKKKTILFSENEEQDNKDKESGGSSSKSLDNKNINLDIELSENKVRVSKNPFNI